MPALQTCSKENVGIAPVVGCMNLCSIRQEGPWRSLG